MLTPQEAEAHVFPKASFGGYNMLQVDTFLDSLIEDYRTLYQENLSLKNKMKVLVNKVEEYRATEDAMRMTLHSAQKMANDLIQDAEAKRQAAIDEITSDALRESEEVRAKLDQQEQEARQQLEDVRAALANEEARLKAARLSTAAYVGKLQELYTREIEYIGGLSELTAEPEELEEPAEDTAPASDDTAQVQQEQVAQEIEANVAKKFDAPGAAPAAAPAQDMQPGQDYKID